MNDELGNNLFAREKLDPNPECSDVVGFSDFGRHFLAGLLDALPDLIFSLAPNINSYKRLVEDYWAPVYLSGAMKNDWHLYA